MLKPLYAGVSRLAVCISLISAQSVWAEEAAGEVEAGNKARMAPSSTKTFSFSELEARGAHGLADLVGANNAGLVIEPSTFNSTAFDLSMRGVSGTSPHQITGESGVGVFVDGASIGRSQGLAMALLDIDTITVARGNQGVLGGRNTTGGAVYLDSSKPTGEFGFEQKIQFGEVGDEFTSITHINLPKFAELLSTKVSYLDHRYDGNVENNNSADSAENFGVRDSEGLRIAIQVDEGGPVSYNYSYLDAEITSTAAYFQNLDTNPVFTDLVSQSYVPESVVDITHHTQTVAIKGDSGLLTAVVSYRDVESSELASFNGALGASVDAFYVDAGDARPSLVEQTQFSQRLQFETTILDGGADLLVGVENFDEQADLDEKDYAGESELETLVLFAQAIFDVTDTMQLTLGWRETSEEKSIRSLNAPGTFTGTRTNIDDDNTNYNIAVNVAASDNLSAFIAYSTGYKSAGASLYSRALTEQGAFRPYEAETMESIEVGIKVNAFDEALTAGVTAFSNNIDDKQITLLDYRGAGNIRVADVVNLADSTQVEGAELDLTVSLLDGLVLSAYYAYTDSETVAVTNPYTGNVVNALAAGTAKHAGGAAIDWLIGDFEAGAVKFHLDYSGVGSYVFNSENDTLGSRDVFNARLSASGFQLEDDSGTIEIGVWVHNLTDDEYLVSSEQVGSTRMGAFGEPRSYGIDVRYSR